MKPDEMRSWSAEVTRCERSHTLTSELLHTWKASVNVAYVCGQVHTPSVLRANQLLADCTDRTVFGGLQDDARRNVLKLEARLGAELTPAYKPLLLTAEWQFLSWLRAPLSPHVTVPEVDDYWTQVAYGCRLITTDAPIQFMLDFCERVTSPAHHNTALGYLKDRVRTRAVGLLIDGQRLEEARAWITHVDDVVAWRLRLLTDEQHREEALTEARYEVYALGRKAERLDTMGFTGGATALRDEQNAWRRLAEEAMGESAR